MLEPDLLLDSCSTTGLRLCDADPSASSPGAAIHSIELERNGLLSCHMNGIVSLSKANAAVEHFELLFQMVSVPGASAPADPQRIARRCATLEAVQGDFMVFSVHLSNQVLVTALPGRHSTLFGSGTRSRVPGSYIHGSHVLAIGCHEQPITKLAIDEESATLVSGDAAGRLRLWPLGFSALSNSRRWSGRPMPSAELHAHNGSVTALAHVKGPGRRLASAGGRDGSVIVWSVARDATSSTSATLCAEVLFRLECGPCSISCLASDKDLCAVGTAHGTLFLWQFGNGNGTKAASLEMMAEHSDGVTSVSLSASSDESGSGQGLCAAADNEGIVRMYRPTLDSEGVWGLVAECDLGAMLSLHVLRSKHLILFGRVFREWPLDHLPTSSDHLPTSSAVGAPSESYEPSEVDASLDLTSLDATPAIPPEPRAPAHDERANDLNAASAAPEPRCAAPPQPAPQPTKAAFSPSQLLAKAEHQYPSSDAFSEDAAFAEKMTHALEAVGRQVFGVEETEDEQSDYAPDYDEMWYSEEPGPSTENAALLASAALQSTHRTAAAAVQRAEALKFDKSTVQVPEARRAALATAAVLTQREGRYGDLAALEPEPTQRSWLPKKQVFGCCKSTFQMSNCF